MPIDSILFAHIQNGAFLSGTYKLEGTTLSNTVKYLKDYLTKLNNSGAYVNPKYTQLAKNMDYLLRIGEAIRASSEYPSAMVATATASNIVEDMKRLALAESLFLPGGWYGAPAGHSMIYTITRTPSHYIFTVFNSGAGLCFHAKKSTKDKELYNPTKTWHLPLFKPEQSNKELINFISRLLQLQLPSQQMSLSCSLPKDQLYKEIFPSIVYANGVEHDTSNTLPSFAFTPGQLSDTCSESVLHVLLKLSADSLHEYQRFIFKYKIDALLEFTDLCFAEPTCSAAIAEQIHLAIENNLKILNTDALFSEEQTEAYFQSLALIKTKLNRVELLTKNINTPWEERSSLSLWETPLTTIPESTEGSPCAIPVLLNIQLSKENFLSDLNRLTLKLQEIKDPALQYNYLEELLLALSINSFNELNHPPHEHCKSISDYQFFYTQIRRLQEIILNLQKEWLKKTSLAKLNILALSALSLQTDVRDYCCLRTGIPSFRIFTNLMLACLLDNQKRNPFLATNHPKIDELFQSLQKKYPYLKRPSDDDFYNYLKNLLETESVLNKKLAHLYHNEYGANHSELHLNIKKNKLESLFMLSLHQNNTKTLDERFKPLIDKMNEHLTYEGTLRRVINLFYTTHYKEVPYIDIGIVYNSFRVSTPLYPTFLPFQNLSCAITEHKYALKPSFAKEALERDVPKSSAYDNSQRIVARTANHIQLYPGSRSDETSRSEAITQHDIIARDYYHLRSNLEVQIILTLDYFKRNIDKLIDQSNQRYVEANLFQPGLLLDELKRCEFFPQFTLFIDTGLRFFTKNGQLTEEAVFFLRVNFLVSQYLALTGDVKGLQRLVLIQNKLVILLNTASETNIIYVLHHYIFLTAMAQIDAKNISPESFKLAYQSYFYMQTHTNPSLLEDNTHRTDAACSIARFQVYLSKQNSSTLKNLIKDILSAVISELQGMKISGSFPIYDVRDVNDRFVYQFNALLGKLFQNNLAQSELPLAVKNNELLKNLQLNKFNQALISADEQSIYLIHDPKETQLHTHNDTLTVRQKWIINDESRYYELGALTENHLAKKRILNTLPRILVDGSMDYWQDTTSPSDGILVQNNKPLYALKAGKFYVLDDNARLTDLRLSALEESWASLLTAFEQNYFLLHHKNNFTAYIDMPRFNLRFNRGPTHRLTLAETGEEVLLCHSPIHPRVAGLVLEKATHQRYLVPIARFYATLDEAELGSIYPITHDIGGVIAANHIQQQKHLNNKSLWHYKNSERYASFRLHEGKPVSDTPAEALYLAYLYLATHQPEQAWLVLEDCRARLGGLAGDYEELQFSSWIVSAVPYILCGESKEDTCAAIRRSPPYVACKLKALSLLCDYLSQDHSFTIPFVSEDPRKANSLWAHKQAQDSAEFLTCLPATIYLTFTLFQSMRRHLDSAYTLSAIERKRLLNYYQQSQGEELAARGALGYEWMQLNLETLHTEQNTLLALKKMHVLSAAEQQRLIHIEHYFKTLKPIIARSSVLKLKPINLDLPNACTIKRNHLTATESEELDQWINKLPGSSCTNDMLDKAITALSSTISESELIQYFPAYLQIALGSNQQYIKPLYDFCTNTLIAKRHLSIENQPTNSLLFSALLYRVLNNKTQIHNLYETFTFKELVNCYKSCTIPALNVYEVQDVYQEILATPEMILKEQIRLPPLPVRPYISVYTPLRNNIPSLNALFEQYQALYKNYEACNELLCTKYTDVPDHARLVEMQAGKNQLHLEQEQIELAKQLIINSDGVDQFLHSARSAMSLKVERQWNQALELANERPSDSKKARALLIDLAAKKRAHLNKTDLYALYIKADLNYTMEKTSLSQEKAQRLHETIHHALIYGIQMQMMHAIMSALTKGKQSGEAQDFLPALDLLAKNEIPGLDVPAIVLLQHEVEIILRARQATAFKTLLEPQTKEKPFKELVEKIIPGGGKSKVILPILAEQKATGNNLVIIEVPQALLATNHVDLNRISQRLFGKSAYRFEFNRDSNSTSKRMEHLYHQFIEVIVTRSYLVTAGESMQSLELKYLELLLTEQKQNEEWTKQVYWCDKLINLIHHHGDAIIDEVHQGLWIKKKLNYTIGTLRPLPPSTIQNAITLFQYIDTDFIKKAPLLNENYDWTSFQEQLATKLLDDSGSPLSAFMLYAQTAYSPQIKKELLDYLTNKAEQQPLAVLNAPTETKAALAFFKQQISVLLPQTLTRRLDEKYGASKRPRLNAIERTLAIPYAANNIPNERSRFGNNLEALNYTCQMLLIKGADREIIKERIALWQAIARQELLQKPNLTHLDQTPTAHGFALQWAKLNLTLSEINLDNEEQIHQIHQLLYNDRVLIFDLLQQHALKLINRDSGLIHSDSFNHIDLYRTVQALSGTPSNHSTYHQRLEYDKSASLGTDGYIIELLHSKNTPISSVNYENTRQFITQIFSQTKSPKHCRAIIDIRAAFQGVGNLEIATELARYIRSHQNQFSTPLKHVLYFNEQQILCALEVSRPESVILLKTSDVNEINRILSTTPNERFTYYDQVRTLGTDLAQDEHAHALVLVDEKISLQAFLQGIMRMRGLSQKQTIQLVTPEQLRGIELFALIQKCSKAENQMLLMDNLFAAKAQMANLIRRICLDFVQNIPAEQAMEKMRLVHAFKAFFVHNPSNDLFNLYGALNKKHPTHKILNQHKEQLINLWQSTLQIADIALSEIQMKNTRHELECIINKALANCLQEYEGSNDALAVEVEVQKEVHKETELQSASLNELYDPDLKECDPIRWNKHLCHPLYQYEGLINSTSISLNKLCTSPAHQCGLFSEEIRASKSYAYSHTKQTKLLDAYLKPASLIWYHIESQVLHAMILTPQDVSELQETIKTNEGNWISTTEDTVICGVRPEHLLHDLSYQSLREQIRFFNGELNSLLDKEQSSCWIKSETIKKLDFFEEHLLPYRPGCAQKTQKLKTVLTQSNTEGFVYIAEHPFDNLTQMDWVHFIPETHPTQAADYQKLAEAFHYIHLNWQISEQDLDTISTKYNLPLSSLGFVNRHLTYIKQLYSLLNCLTNLDIKAITENRLNLIPEKDQAFLKRYLVALGTNTHTTDQNNYESIYKQFGLSTNQTHALNPEQSTIAYINLLKLISSDPAIKNTQPIIEAYYPIARKTDSVAVLYMLLELRPICQKLITHVMTNPILEEELTQKLLDLAVEFTEYMMENMATRNLNETQIRALLQKGPVTDFVLLSLLLSNRSKKLLLELIPHVTAESRLRTIYEQANTDKEVRLAVYAHSLFTPDCLIAILKSNTLAEDELLVLLNNSRDRRINQNVLAAVVTNTQYSEKVLLAAALHVQANGHIIELILQRDTISSLLIQQIIKDKGSYIEFETMEHIAAYAYKNGVNSANTQKLYWQNTALQAFAELLRMQEQRKKFRPNSTTNFLSPTLDLIDALTLEHEPGFAIELLRTFKQQIIKKINLLELIRYVDSDEKELLFLIQEILSQKNQLLQTPLMNQLAKTILEQYAKGTDKKTQWQDMFLELSQLAKEQDYSKKLLELNPVKNLITPSFGLKLLAILGAQVLDQIPLKEMILRAQFEDINLCLDIEVLIQLSEELALILFAKCTTVEQVLLFLKKPDLSPYVLQQVITKSPLVTNNSKLLAVLASHPQTNNDVFLNDLAQQAFALLSDEQQHTDLECCFNSIFERLSALNITEQIEELIRVNSAAINPNIGLLILKHFNRSLVPQLSLTKMISTATNEAGALEQFIEIKELTPLELKQLARKMLSIAQIDSLLARTDMNAETANLLMKQPSYSGIIHNWPWLTPIQLLNTLSSTRHIASFNTALRHRNLSESATRDWFDEMKSQHQKTQLKNKAPVCPEVQLQDCLENLKLKAYTHAVKALTQEKYLNAANTAFELYQQLSVQTELLSKKPDELAQSVTRLIHNAYPVLGEHRGYKQIILDILNRVLAVVTLGAKTPKAGDWRFFKANTDSVNIINAYINQLNANINQSIRLS